MEYPNTTDNDWKFVFQVGLEIKISLLDKYLNSKLKSPLYLQPIPNDPYIVLFNSAENENLCSSIWELKLLT